MNRYDPGEQRTRVGWISGMQPKNWAYFLRNKPTQNKERTHPCGRGGGHRLRTGYAGTTAEGQKQFGLLAPSARDPRRFRPHTQKMVTALKLNRTWVCFLWSGEGKSTHPNEAPPPRIPPSPRAPREKAPCHCHLQHPTAACHPKSHLN